MVMILKRNFATISLAMVSLITVYHKSFSIIIIMILHQFHYDESFPHQLKGSYCNNCYLVFILKVMSY